MMFYCGLFESQSSLSMVYFFAIDVVYDSAKPVFGVWPLKLLLCYLLGQLRVGQVSVNIWDQ